MLSCHQLWGGASDDTPVNETSVIVVVGSIVISVVTVPVSVLIVQLCGLCVVVGSLFVQHICHPVYQC